MIRLENIHKSYAIGSTGTLPVLRGVDLELPTEGVLAVRGASGSGKSTLLQIMGGIDHPTLGRVWTDGRDLSDLSPRELAAWRGKTVGFVFQSYHLMPELNLLENVALPAWLAGRDGEERARELIDEVGLSDRIQHRPGELSGGEQQRVALARALVNDPALVLADEPTGNLDRATGDEVVHLLEELNGRGVTLIVVTHDPGIGSRAGRQLLMEDGQLRHDSSR